MVEEKVLISKNCWQLGILTIFLLSLKYLRELNCDTIIIYQHLWQLTQSSTTRQCVERLWGIHH